MIELYIRVFPRFWEKANCYDNNPRNNRVLSRSLYVTCSTVLPSQRTTVSSVRPY